MTKKRKITSFIDDEAELSGGASDDELDHEDLDAFDASFVDDATQKEVSIDQRAVYLQSIRLDNSIKPIHASPIGNLTLF